MDNGRWTGRNQQLYCRPEEAGKYIMPNMARLLKLPALTLKRKHDLEQLSKDWEEYANSFKTFLKTTTVAHENTEAAGTPCEACRT